LLSRWAFALRSVIYLAPGALLGACQVGAADVPIGADVQSVFFVSPAGDDSAAGTRASPWRTLERATSSLTPGQTLELMTGDYLPETTGVLSVDCSGGARSGRPGAPITIRAESERGARLHGDGAVVPLELANCDNWVIEGLLLTNEHNPDVPKGVDVGTVALIRSSRDLTLRRLLLMRSNHDRHTHLLRLLESDRVLVEECEAYDFFHNAFEAVRTQAVIFRRNYFHSRYATSQGNIVGTDEPTRGETAIQVEESSGAILENNVAEVVGTGFAIVARSVGSPYTDAPRAPVSGARLFGNLVRDALGPGFRVESRCDDANPCIDPARIVSDTLIVNGVVLDADAGYSVDAGPGTRFDNVSAIDVKNGVVIQRSDANLGREFAASAARANVRGYTGVAFWASGAEDWSFDHCAAQNPGTEAVDYSPQAGVLQPISAPNADACLAYLGKKSALREAAGADGDVGASVLYRSVSGLMTTEPLWDRKTGQFACGAIVPGINDDPTQSCSGVHERFRIGSADCPLPYPEAP
jgi:hypothetical protein